MRSSHKAPAVAVIIPVFNRPIMVAEAVASVLAQDYPALEVIVVDDGSSDSTASVVQQLAREHQQVNAVFLEENSGQSAARNRGAQSTEASLFAFLDSDDLLPAGRICQQIDALASSPGSVAVMGRMEVQIGEGVDPPPMVSAELGLGSKASSVGTAMIRSAAFHAAGGFDEELRFADDIDFLYRLRLLGQIDQTESVWLSRRIHGRNLVYDTVGIRRGMFEALRRRRAEADRDLD